MLLASSLPIGDRDRDFKSDMQKLSERRCLPCEGLGEVLSAQKINELLATVPGWALGDDGGWISRRFDFRDYSSVMTFVNAIARMAQQENHHPEMDVRYGHCVLRYSTHALRGLTDNDFICAAKANALFE